MAESLNYFFNPKHIALIGATERTGTVGRALVTNLVCDAYQGRIFLVNTHQSSVLGHRCYPTIGSVPAKIDLAVIATPAATVPATIRECAQAGVQGVIVISAGFREAGASGAALEQAILAERGGMRIIGPNCLGLMNPHSGLNATFASRIAQPGTIGFISQSGALCTAILDWSQREMVGFSAFVSVGSMLDVGWGDLIDYLGNDSKTQSIIIYMESVGDARSFLSVAREVALAKPIIVIKPGRTAAGAQAAASHTGALTGSDAVLDAAFRRCGVLRVNTIAELFYMAEALGKQPRPQGPRLAIVTNAGGPGVLATDALLGEGGQLAELSPESIEQLNQALPRHWSHHNPIDVLGDAGPERFSKAIEVALADPNSDGMLVILAPQAVTDPTVIAQQLTAYAHGNFKPVLASWMGGVDIAAGESILNRAGIPTYPYPDSAAKVFHSMWQYSDNLRALYETPGIVEEPAGREKAAQIIAHVRESGRTLLTEAESKALLAAYGIPTVETAIAADEDQAVAHAIRLVYPVVLKLHSETITHKTDVGGVRLNLASDAEVRAAFQAIRAGVPASDFLGVTVQPMIRMEGYELILGSSIDSQFGPVLLFGTGGQLVEVFRDQALGLPPLNTTLARRMMERTKIFKALLGVRGRKPVDIEELERLLVRFSELVIEQPWIKEIDVNPLLASPERLLALDARVVLHPAATAEKDLPRSAIRPYPSQYVKPWHFENGDEVQIRPIRPEDEPLMVQFHSGLSERSVFLRYFHMMDFDHRVAHARLTRQCFIDYAREMALVAIQSGRMLAVARLTKSPVPGEAELAVLILDELQGKGLGTELVVRLLAIARAENITRVTADMLYENVPMQHVLRALGFSLRYELEERVVKAEFNLEPVQ